MKKGCNTPEMAKQRAEGFFYVYYLLGSERTLKKVAEYGSQLGAKISASTLMRWSQRFGWQQRILELDAKLQEARDKDAVEQVRQMNDRQAELGRAMQTIGVTTFKKLLDSKKAVKAETAALLAKEGIKIERLAMGESTSRDELVQTMNSYTMRLAAIFLEVNEISDPEERKRAFAEKADSIVEGEMRLLKAES